MTLNATKNTKKEKTISEMYEQKQKTITRLADRKLSSMETANVLNAAKDLVIAFPDNWKEKLDDVILCASFIVDIKEDNFLHSMDMMKKLKHGGLLSVVDDNRQYKEDYSEDPFKNCEKELSNFGER